MIWKVLSCCHGLIFLLITRYNILYYVKAFHTTSGYTSGSRRCITRISRNELNLKFSSPITSEVLETATTITKTTKSIRNEAQVLQSSVLRSSMRTHSQTKKQNEIGMQLAASVISTTGDRINLSSLDVDDIKDGSSDQNAKLESELIAGTLRPLHQNWWPVSTIDALKKDRPNALQVLGKRLVAFWTGSEWAVLDDACSHRFAPLSEGRIIPSTSVTTASKSTTTSTNKSQKNEQNSNGCSSCSNRIQCSYHGWEFDKKGSCVRIPQIDFDLSSPPTNKKNKAIAPDVGTYKSHVRVGMLWVFMDRDDSENLSDSLLPLPINPLLEDFVEKFGLTSIFMRDLPYGMEILGENLLDLSHLPFSHHSVGMLKRDLGKPLPFRMMSLAEKKQYAQWEEIYINNKSNSDNSNKRIIDDRNQFPLVIPRYQAEILDTANHDPIMMISRSRLPADTNTTDWKTVVSYYDPSHIRYRRTRGTKPENTNAMHVEIFMCPTSEGHSRVFLLNCGEILVNDPPKLFPKPSSSFSTWSSSLRDMISLKPIQARLQYELALKFLNPRNTRVHMMSHNIFDGDGIFLHKQGHRMRSMNYTYQDYATPSSADVLLNAYRRFLYQAATVTRHCLSLKNSEGNAIADSVVGTGQYNDNKPRSALLERYNSHTVHCSVCSSALQSAMKAKKRLQTFQTAMTGAFGASTTGLLLSLTASIFQRIYMMKQQANFASASTLTTVFPSTLILLPTYLILRTMIPFVGISYLLTMWSTRSISKLEQTIQSFRFIDYIHAEKD